MAGIAQLARAGGYAVRGCDAGVYPPMSTLLRSQNIEVLEDYLPAHLGGDPGMVIIGNALSRGNPLVEHVLNEKLAFCSAPEWLREQVLARRTVIAIAGTHGKTTTASILAWLLECAGQSPGYLIGGKPGNFAQSARLGDGEYFVVEGDEYDTAFFDKRAKFVHYRPHIAVLNNLEFDHADIYDDVEQIQKQFHHLIRIVPGNGCVVVNADDPRLAQVMDRGCWSKVVRFSTAADGGKNNAKVEWRAVPVSDDCSSFDVLHHEKTTARVNWQCMGMHNMQNALAALAAAEVAGVSAAAAVEYLSTYLPAERRLQLLFESDEVCVYDDFAHHPTAIRHTIHAVRAKHPGARIIAVVEPRSNTMKMGVHGARLGEALALADCAILCANADCPLPVASNAAATGAKSGAKSGAQSGAKSGGEILRLEQADEIISAIGLRRSGNDVIITMSNGDFGGLPRRIAETFGSGT